MTTTRSGQEEEREREASIWTGCAGVAHRGGSGAAAPLVMRIQCWQVRCCAKLFDNAEVGGREVEREGTIADSSFFVSSVSPEANPSIDLVATEPRNAYYRYHTCNIY